MNNTMLYDGFFVTAVSFGSSGKSRDLIRAWTLKVSSGIQNVIPKRGSSPRLKVWAG